MLAFTIIEPGDVRMTRTLDWIYWPGYAGSGFFADVVIYPRSVCFGNIETQEQKAIAVANGWYEDKGLNGYPHPQGPWNRVNDQNNGIEDQIGTAPPGLSPSPAFGVGSLVWRIPWHYRKAGSASSILFVTVDHTQVMWGATGEETTEKGGAKRTLTPSPPL